MKTVEYLGSNLPLKTVEIGDEKLRGLASIILYIISDTGKLIENFIALLTLDKHKLFIKK